MANEPSSGRIVIEWNRLLAENAPPDVNKFDWHVKLEPPGLSDEALSRLLAEIASRF